MLSSMYLLLLCHSGLPAPAYQSHMRASAHKALASFAATPVYVSSPSLYGTGTEHNSKVKQPFSIVYIEHCVKRSEKCPIFFNENRRVIRSRWLLVEYITTFTITVTTERNRGMIVLGGWPKFLLICWHQNETKTTLDATARTATSIVISSYAYRTMSNLNHNGIACIPVQTEQPFDPTV